jgi:hypothetical protein
MLHDFLFQNEGTELVNLKLLRGDSPDVSKEEICDQIHSAIIQVASGEAASMEDFPDIAGVGSINLLEFEKQF